MGQKAVYIDVNLDDFDIDDVIEHALTSTRALSKSKNKKKLEQLREYLDINEPQFEIESLDDKLKLEHLLKVFKKYSTTYIEQQLPL